MGVSADLVRAARETYDLERQINGGLSTDALEKAISSALEAHERAVLHRLATEAESYALGMESEEHSADFVLALRWWAHKVREDLGPQDSQLYEPRDDDVVEVTITGSVITSEDPYGPSNEFHWAVFDDKTGDEYSFRNPGKRAPRLRVLSRHENMEEK